MVEGTVSAWRQFNKFAVDNQYLDDLYDTVSFKSLSENVVDSSLLASANWFIGLRWTDDQIWHSAAVF